MKRIIILASLVIIVQMACIAAAQSNIAAFSGKWDITANGYSGTITFDGGRVFDLAYKGSDEALTAINFDGKVIKFTRISTYGPDSNQDYTGEVSGDTMTGTFTEVNMPGSIFQWSASRENNSPVATGSAATSPSVSTPTVVNNTPTSTPQNEGTYLDSRTEYIRDDTNNKMLPGVLILLSAWKHGTTTDELVPNTPIYITILEEGSKVIHLESTVTTGVNGYVFFKWIFNDSEKNKKWIINFSPDSSNPYAQGYTATTVSSYIPDDLSAFTLESEIVSAYKGVS